MEKYQVVAVDAAWYGQQEAVTLTLRNESYEKRHVTVTGTEVSLGLFTEGLDEEALLSRLDFCLKKLDYSECKRIYCPHCRPRAFPVFCSPISSSEKTYLNNNVCPKDAEQNRCRGLMRSEPLERHPLIMPEDDPMHYLHIVVSSVEEVIEAERFIKNFQKRHQPKRSLWGAYNIQKTIVDYFLLESGVTPMSWIEIPAEDTVISIEQIGKLGIGENRFTSLLYDIETVSDRPNCVCDPSMHPVGMISMVLQGAEERRLLLHWNEREVRVADCEVIKLSSEAEMLARFFELSADADFLIGHNSGSFDWPYISQRAQICQVPLTAWAVPNCYAPRLTRKQKVTAQAGTVDMAVEEYPGKTFIDTRLMCMEKLNLERNRLKDMAKHCGVQGKDEFDYNEIWPAWTEGIRLHDMGKYCLQDSIILRDCLKIMDWLNQVAGMSYVCHVTPQSVVTRGKGYLVSQTAINNFHDTHVYPSPMSNEFMEFEIDTSAISHLPKKKQEEKIKNFPRKNSVSPRLEHLVDGNAYGLSGYGGGMVLDPVVGLHTEPCVVFDFASLYPSIMKAFGICPSTCVGRTDPQEKWPWLESDRYFVAPNGYIFDRHRFGIMTSLLTLLLNKRKECRKIAEEEGDTPRGRAFDALQLSYKEIANVCYGQMGAIDSMLSFQPGAEGVTMVGQFCLMMCKSFFDNIKEIQERGIGVIFKPPQETQPFEMQALVDADPEVFYGDTDSLFIRYRKKGITWPEVFKVNKLFDEIMVNHMGFLKPMKFEYEETYCPLVITEKKRYAALKIKFDEEGNRLPGVESYKIRGLPIVNRSYFPFLQTLMKDFITKIFLEGVTNIHQITLFLHERLNRLARGQVGLDELRMSVGLNKNYEEYGDQKLIQKTLVEILRKSGTNPSVGDRIAYFIVQVNRRKAGATERAFPELLMAESGQVPDYSEYFRKVCKPMKPILENTLGVEITNKLLSFNYYNSNCTNMSVEEDRYAKFANPEYKPRFPVKNVEAAAPRGPVQQSLGDYMKKRLKQ